MNIKRFLVSDMSEAMNRIKVELGPDAVILNTRNVKKNGIKGFFRPPMIEVIAAAEAGQSKKTAYAQDNKYEALLESKINSLSEQFETMLNKAQESQKGAQIESKDITSDEDIIVKIGGTAAHDNAYIKKLIDADIRESIAVKIVEEAEEIKKKRQDADMTDIIRHLLLQYLGTPSPVKIAKYRRKVIFLVGPTGVGKTTTIAKLAAIYSLKKQAKVCLVTCDTYRIAAVDQLNTYAKILDIPLEVVNTPADFGAILSKYEQADVILVDTTGRSPNDSVKQEEIAPLLDICDNYEIYLVLSAITSYKGAMHIIKNYAFLDDYKLIFTKMDETPDLGNIINILYECKKGIGYITTGQNVPDDIIELGESNLGYITQNII